MMMLQCILYATLLPLPVPLSQRAIAVELNNWVQQMTFSVRSDPRLYHENHSSPQALTQCPGVQLGYPVPGGYKYGNLAFQVGEVSYETVKYGFGFCATQTIESLHCKLQTRPLVREGASQI
jgi:hypothetical protein